ncbi:Mitochondrial distribution and morphology protein 10 [Coemansia sp. RSA 2703]|nr:Mitochondrial distribution and morphology protein 10 [Coemansia sp. RSA 2703]KAJ2377690.1 Mitochondrial distribution and morphology protein 10 [Coemansia sp. RSA 2607]KAJ2398218.1 Mitochondrial distribution and morphology protein 10 [Coemansia sp. RSA 2603]
MFTAPDYFPFLIRQFHRETRWDEHNSYSSFCKSSQEIIDFSIPRGVSVGAGRSIGSGLSSQLVFSMIPNKSSSIGYLAASRPLFTVPPLKSRLDVSANTIFNECDEIAETVTSSGAHKPYTSDAMQVATEYPTNSDVIDGFSVVAAAPVHSDFAFLRRQQIFDERDIQSLLGRIRSGGWKCNWEIGKPDTKHNDSSSSVSKDYMMVAQMYPSLSSITGSYISQRSPTSELTISGVSVAGAHPDLQLIAQYAVNKRRWSSETILATSGKLIGLRSRYNFGNVEALDKAAYAYYCGTDDDARRVLREKTHGRFSIGSEVYYGAQDSSGGVSVGAQYRYDLPLFSELTCVLNPIMGHLSLAWMQQLRPQFCAAARYDFNVYSLNSELAMGVEWQLDHNSIIKAGWSGSQGLRCLIDTRFSNMIFSLGLAFNSDSSSIRLGPGSSAMPSTSSSGMKRLVRSFGLQFQWFL